MYSADRGIEELDERQGGDQVMLGWLAAMLQAFIDLHPRFDVPVGRLAAWLARGRGGGRHVNRTVLGGLLENFYQFYLFK